MCGDFSTKSIIDDNNQAVDTYDDAESSDFDVQQKAEALALQVMQTADAAGHLAAIQAFDANYPLPPGEGQGEGNPWADLAAAQAAALSAQQTSQANALLTQSDSSADAQETAEQAQADALSAQDDAEAQAEDKQETTDAQSDHDQAVAQAATADGVHDDLPDTLVAPADGPDQTLTADFVRGGYEANEFYVGGNPGVFWQFAGGGGIPELGAPDFLPFGLMLNATAYSWGTAGMLYGYLGSMTPWTPDGSLYMGANLTLDIGTPSVGYSDTPYKLYDLVRGDSLPIQGTFAPAMHFSGAQADLLDLSKAPSAVGAGGYSNSPLPTTTAGTQAANASATSSAPAPMSLSSPAPSAMSQAAAAPAGGVQSGGNTTPQTPQQPASGGEAPAANEGTDSADVSARPEVSATVVIVVLPKEPDPAKEAPNKEDRPTGESDKSTGQPQQELAEPDKKAGAAASTLATAEQRAAAALESRQELVDELGREPTSKELYMHQRNRAAVAIDNLGGVPSELGADIFVAFVPPERNRSPATGRGAGAAWAGGGAYLPLAERPARRRWARR
ncbi:MAG TPA: hypothetical protein VF278_15890 [Pirellulales bacterium]